MLTDYHVHLRADDDDRPPELEAFTSENAERYLAAAAEAGVDELGCSEHVYRFTAGARRLATPVLGGERHRRPRRLLRVRADHPAEARPRGRLRARAPRTGLASLLDGRDLDYALGSVHFVGDRAVDHEGWDVWDRTGDPDEVWRRYFEALAEAARSGLFDILAHPDLVKVWGAARPAPASAIRASTTSRPWRRSPRPASRSRSRPPGFESRWGSSTRRRRWSTMCVDAGASFALSSDAHSPGDVGHGYERGG